MEAVSLARDPGPIGKVTQVAVVGPRVEHCVPRLRGGEALAEGGRGGEVCVCVCVCVCVWTCGGGNVIDFQL